VVHALAETYIAQRLSRTFLACNRVNAGVDEGKLNVPQAGGAGEQIKGLEDESDLLVPDLGQLVAVHRRNVFAIELITSGAGRIEAAEHVHECRLATAARPHDGEVFVPMDLERDAAQGMHRLFAHHVMLGDVLDIDDDIAMRPNTGGHVHQK
jgi:hypothetical protein